MFSRCSYSRIKQPKAARNYSKEFGKWTTEHHFDRMPKSTRRIAIELAENEQAITGWRNGLPERQRLPLRHPQSLTRHWRAATGPPSDKSSTDLKRDAEAAWRRFLSLCEALPPDLAASLWSEAQAQAQAALSLRCDVGVFSPITEDATVDRR